MKQLPLIIVLLVLLIGALIYLFRPQFGPVTSTYTHEFDSVWQIYEDDQVSFTYPEHLPGTYIREIDWPPKVDVLEEYACEAEETEMGRTVELASSGNHYCVSTRTEGAAGSIYADYRYVTEKDGKAYALTFSVKRVQCANYDEPEQTACSTEQEYDIDAMAVRIAESVVFK